MPRYFSKSPFPLLLDRTILFCFLLSSIGHLFFLMILFLFSTPPEGHPDGDSLQVVLQASAEKEGSMLDASPSSLESLPESFADSPEDLAKASPEESNGASDEITNDTLEDIQSLLKTTHDGEAQQYLEKRRQKAMEQKKNRDAFREVQEKISRGIAARSKYGTLEPRTFYGVAVLSKKMIFVLDTSGSMDILEADLQLLNALKSLKKDEYFNIVLYAAQVCVWQKKLMPATPENQALAIQWIQKKKPGGATNIYEALKTALDVAVVGEKAEVVYFLSDGVPMLGVQDPEKILLSVREWNLSKRIVIHTIGIGPHQNKEFLKPLAEQNHGTYFEK